MVGNPSSGSGKVALMTSTNVKSNRRGRPFAFDRDIVLSRAAMTFWRLGYEGASIGELTAAMNDLDL
jgi:hypothetical protein